MTHLKSFYYLAFLLATHTCVIAQKTGSVYDSAYAKRLGADKMGMKKFVLVMLKSGSLKNAGKPLTDSLLKGHFANMERLANMGRLLTAGPVGKNEHDYRGLFLFNTSSVDSAQAWAQSDPSVKGGLFNVEAFVWYGTAAVMELPRIHKQINPSAR